MPRIAYFLPVTLFMLTTMAACSHAQTIREEGQDDEAEVVPRGEESPSGRRPARRSRRTDPAFTSARSAAAQRATARERYSRLPAMWGDTFAFTGSLLAVGGSPSVTDVPLAAGVRGGKIAENTKVLPDDRWYFSYSQFHGAIASNAAPAQSFDVNRYLFGFEKTFSDGMWSIETRIPFSGQTEFDAPNFAVFQGGEAGNVSVFLKGLVMQGPGVALTTGLGVDIPIGADIVGHVNNNIFTIENDSFHIAPFIGSLWFPAPYTFVQGFTQLDFAATGNDITFAASSAAPGRAGVATDQPLFYLDAQFGRWLYCRPVNSCRSPMTISRIAAVAELHWTAALSGADVVASNQGGTAFTYTTSGGRFSVVNLTLGLFWNLANQTEFRIGGVVPITSGGSRFFDSELQFVISRRM